MGKYTAIDDSSAHFQTLLWTGNSTDARALTNDGNSDLQPDWVWLKNRNAGYNHFLQDSSRGNTKVLSSDSTAAESTFTNMVESFDTNGFTIGFDGSQVPNFNGNTFVGWQWKANGGSTASNTDGDVTTTVQANQDAGFSIVTWTTGTTAGNITAGHGLGAVPNVVIYRARGQAQDWLVYHHSLGTNHYTKLNTTAAKVAYDYTVGAGVTSSVFGYRYPNTVFGNQTYLAYCFAEKQGFSKFGKYIGNGVADGPFVYTGFKPAFVMIKNASAVTNWYMWDNKRNPYNVVNNGLNANTANATQGTAYDSLDFLSNGFKIRDYADGTWNGSGNTIIYMAFAENPFVTSTGIMGTAQ